MHRFWDVYVSGYQQFEVVHKTHRYYVDLPQRTCSCRAYQLSGIPCVHAMAGIGYLNMNAEEFVAHCFTKEAFLASYDYTITPLNDSSMWPVTKLLAPLPPRKRRLPGRPQVKRRRDAAEKEISGSRQRLSRAGQTQRCSICKAIGHNKARCPSNVAGTSNENPQNEEEAAGTSNVTQTNVSQATPHNEEEPASESEEEPASESEEEPASESEEEPATPQNEVPATQESVNQVPSVRGRGRGNAAVRGRGRRNASVRGREKPPVVGRRRGRSERIAILRMKKEVVPKDGSGCSTEKPVTLDE